MPNFSVNVIIITIGALWSCVNCADEVIFRNRHAGGQRLMKQQNKKVISCPTPTTSADKIFTVYDWDDEPITNLSTWSRIPKFFYLTSQCSGGYSFLDRNDTYSAYCGPKGEWEPYLKPCTRVCPTLHISDVDLTCKDKRQGIIDCNGPLPSGSQVTAKCKPTHHAGSEFQPDYYDSMRCKDDGRWNKGNFSCVQDCGKPILQPLIANGLKSEFGEFPWHTAIYSIPKNYLLLCGGTLISTNIVLSAAHCFFDDIAGVPKRDPKDYVIVVGKMTRDYNTSDNYMQKKYEVSEILFAEREYNPSINGYSYDIALVILKENVTLSPYVLPACFKRHGSVGFKPENNNTQGAVPGWGRDENDTPSKTLKFARLDYIDYDECSSKKVAGVTLDKFCAGVDNGPRPLKGDSGGGIVFKIGSLYYIRGIVSARDTSSYSSITTFTDISYYEDWIQIIIDERSEHKTTLSSTLSTPTRTSTNKIVHHNSTTTSRTRVTSFRPTSPPPNLSFQKPFPKQIIKKKCVDYAKDKFQNVCSSGNTADKAEIVGGTGVSEKEFPHMASIGYVGHRDEIRWLCSGTLISTRFILTAAQCIKSIPSKLSPKWVLLGTVYRSDLKYEQVQKNRLATIGETYIHPGYKRNFVDHDIALIELQEPVTFSAHIRPVCLHTDYDVPKGYLNNATILGWAFSGGYKNSTLQKATVRFLSNELCSQVFANERKLKKGFDNNTMVCAGDPNSELDTCIGDLGGPIQMRHEMECMYVQVGITSLGSTYCGDGLPVFYTRVSSYLDWIQQIVWRGGGDH